MTTQPITAGTTFMDIAGNVGKVIQTRKNQIVYRLNNIIGVVAVTTFVNQYKLS